MRYPKSKRRNKRRNPPLPPCEHCNGAGFVRIEANTLKPCTCPAGVALYGLASDQLALTIGRAILKVIKEKP